MKRPSTLILGFIFTVASIFLAYAFGRMFFRVINSPEVVPEDYGYESQLNILQDTSLKSTSQNIASIN